MIIQFLAISLIIIFCGYKVLQRQKLNLPPGPRPWPIFGNMLQVQSVAFRCLAEWSRQYGPIMSFWNGQSLDIIVSNPQLAKEVLKDNDQHLANRSMTKAITQFSKNGNDLTWADYGPRFVKLRKICVLELFSPKSIEAHRSIREEEVSIMIKAIYLDSYGKVFILRNYLKNAAFDIISRMILGKRFRTSNGALDSEGHKLKKITQDQIEINPLLGIVGEIWWFRWVTWPKDNEIRKFTNFIYQFFQYAIREREFDAIQNCNNPSFLDSLLSRRDEYDISNNTISGLLWDMVTAGMDTSAVTVEWAMTELLKNPMVQKKAQMELNTVIGSQTVMGESDLQNLPYLRCLVKETFRLHPPTPLMLPHKTDTTLNVRNYHIPKGSNVIVNVWAIGRDPDVWEDPHQFRPERFLKEDIDIKGHDFRLLPFGSGRRSCPGAQVGFILVSLMVGRLLHHFEWSLPQGLNVEDIDMSEVGGIVIFKKTPLEAVLTPRFPI